MKIVPINKNTVKITAIRYPVKKVLFSIWRFAMTIPMTISNRINNRVISLKIALGLY